MIDALVRYLGERWTAVRGLGLADWSNLATTLGIVFVAAQVFTWKRLKIRELRASVARELAAKVNAATDATCSALLDPEDHLSGKATTLWVELDEMRVGYANESVHAADPLRQLRQEVGVARLHFSDGELEACRGVLRFCGDTPARIAEAFDLAVQRISEGDAVKQFASSFAALRDEADIRRERAMGSLRDVASYEPPSMTQRIWRRLRGKR